MRPQTGRLSGSADAAGAPCRKSRNIQTKPLSRLTDSAVRRSSSGRLRVGQPYRHAARAEGLAESLVAPGDRGAAVRAIPVRPHVVGEDAIPVAHDERLAAARRSEEHTSELQ